MTDDLTASFKSRLQRGDLVKIATATGLSVVNLYRYTVGLKVPRARVAVAVAASLDIDLDKLLTGKSSRRHWPSFIDRSRAGIAERLRLRHGDLKAAADAIGLPQSTLFKTLSGARNDASLATVRAIADGLSVSMADVAGILIGSSNRSPRKERKSRPVEI